jgi:hypothetical protein
MLEMGVSIAKTLVLNRIDVPLAGILEAPYFSHATDDASLILQTILQLCVITFASALIIVVVVFPRSILAF